MYEFESLDPNTDKLIKHGDNQQIIAAIVKSLPKGMHITALDVYKKTKEMGIDVSISTVYRALHKLRSTGNISTVSGDRGLRYESMDEGHDHDHLICLGCGLTIEFIDDLIRGFGKNVAQRKGFEHKSSRFDILGYCSDCISQDQTHIVERSTEYLVEALARAEHALANLKQAISLQQTRKYAKAGTYVVSSCTHLKKALEECQSSQRLLANIAEVITS